MPRKEMISATQIAEAAFDMTRQEGIEQVTARKLAVFAGCSTQPIFRVYRNMDECYHEVFLRAIDFFDSYYTNYEKKSTVPFVDLGMAYISFAQKETNLFTYLFMRKNNENMNMYNLLNGRSGAVKLQMTLAKSAGVNEPEVIFMKMWMLIHGAACMVITGDYDLSPEETKQQLTQAYRAFTV